MSETKMSKRRDYLRVIVDACPPNVWQQIVEKAVQDALAGDARARAWLTAVLIDKEKADGIDAWEVQDPAGYDEYEALPEDEKFNRMFGLAKY